MAESGFSWLGIRDDLDLDHFWWHRLAKVVFWAILAIAVGITLFVVFEGDGPELQADYDRIEVIANLNQVLSNTDPTISNAIAAFLANPGRLGVRNDAEERVEPRFLLDYYLRRSICTPDAVLHAQEVADTLNSMNYTRANTATTVLMTLRQTNGQYAPNQRFCWFESAIQGPEIDDFVKYEFTRFGLLRAWWDYSTDFIFWFAVAIVAVTNVYYRGFVYVVCGPRGKVKEKYLKKPLAPTPNDSESDSDFDEMLEEVDEEKTL